MTTAVWIVLATLLLPACGAAADGAGLASGPRGASPAPVIVTEASNGQTVRLATTDQARLRLTTHYRWAAPHVAGESISLASVALGPGAGYQEWVIGFRGPGTSTITSTATPVCSPGQICPHHVLAYSVTVIVG